MCKNKNEYFEEPAFYCPICNFKGMYEPAYWLKEGQEEPSYGSGNDDICPCCGFQFNLHDFDYNSPKEAVEDWRRKWIEGGCEFRHDYQKPKDWSLEKAKKQLAELKDLHHYCEYRKDWTYIDGEWRRKADFACGKDTE